MRRKETCANRPPRQPTLFLFTTISLQQFNRASISEFHESLHETIAPMRTFGLVTVCATRQRTAARRAGDAALDARGRATAGDPGQARGTGQDQRENRADSRAGQGVESRPQ